MTALIVIGCILLVLILIGLIRAGVEVEYSQDGFAMTAHAGPVSIQILPPKEGEEKEKKPKKKKKKKAEKEEPEPEQEKPKQKKNIGGTIDLVLEAIPVVKKFLSRFFHRLLIKDLTIYFGSAGEDPYKAATTFGYVSAAAGMIVPFLENHFRIKNRDIQTGVSFETDKPFVYIHAWLSIAVWEVIYAISGLIKFGFHIIISIGKQKRKAVNEHGKTSDRGSDGVHNVENPGNG